MIITLNNGETHTIIHIDIFFDLVNEKMGQEALSYIKAEIKERDDQLEYRKDCINEIDSNADELKNSIDEFVRLIKGENQ